MSEQHKNTFKNWLIGFLTGGAVFAPIAAFITKRICDKKYEEMSILVTKPSDIIPSDIISSDRKLTEDDYAVKSMKPSEMDLEPDVDINDYDVTIDDHDAMEDTKDRTEEHIRYLDMINKYNGDDVIKPHVISGDDFVNEHYMEKSYVNWYEDDNVFEEELSVIDDPFATFGVTNGKELFNDTSLRTDPDICYVRNEKVSTDFEINRIHGSYSQIVGGEMGLGETDS